MRASLLTQLVAAAYLAPVQAKDDYAPTYTECPKSLSVRKADGLSDEEKSWRDTRKEHVMDNLESYLNNAKIEDFDIKDYMRQINSSSVPMVGLSISGGGTQSGLGGFGVWQAFDSRYKGAVEAGTGGLVQLTSYITGLSGGGAVTVSLLAATDFTTIDKVRDRIDFSVPYDEGPSKNKKTFFKDIFEDLGEKAEKGFPVNVGDTFGRFWATWLPDKEKYANYHDIARDGSAFTKGDAPMPILAIAEVVPGESPEIKGIMWPGRNKTNGFNLTSYEVTPYEFGSWAGGRIQGFMPTKWLGTSMTKGKVQNESECVEGFDKLSFMQGTTANAFCVTIIDALYNIPLFAKRGLEERQKDDQGGQGDIPIPKDQQDNPFVQLTNETGSVFDQTFNESLWSTVPNPFQDYNDEMNGIDELLLVDGSLAGETNPIRPLIVPEREMDFVIVYEASSDSKYHWVNGTNLINTAASASEGDIPFPAIPNVDTMITQNFTKQPTFFGCNYTDETPLVLYLPNSPWTGYSNFSFKQPAFSDNEFDLTIENAFQLATYGNRSIDENWPACLACATIRGSLRRAGIDLPNQCESCFDRHCWDGKESSDRVTDEDQDPRPRLNASLSYEEWNSGTWKAQSRQQEDSDDQASSLTSVPAPAALYMAVALATFVVFLG